MPWAKPKGGIRPVERERISKTIRSAASKVYAEESGEVGLPTDPCISEGAGNKKASSCENARFAFNGLRDFAIFIWRLAYFHSIERIGWVSQGARDDLVSENALLGSLLTYQNLCWKKTTPPTRPSFTHNLIFSNDQNQNLIKRWFWKTWLCLKMTKPKKTR